MSPAQQLNLAWWSSLLALFGLLGLCLAWELWLIPSWYVLKIAPLMLALFGFLHRKPYTYKWMSMASLLYFIEGVMHGWADRGVVQYLGWGEIAFSLVLYVASIVFVRAGRKVAAA